MTGNGFTVEPDELDTHAASLDGVAQRVQAEGERGGGIDFGIDAFGIVGQAFSTQARQTSSEAAEQIAGYAQDIRDLGTAVRAAGRAYVESDKGHAEPFRGGDGG
ncbi:Protein of unknown function (DUF2580) [Saccharomonospora marina XMU15]|uniref:Excreted virulence factor EspC, type VII ESX diderm n=1 Tax=Saccharomonospora marina XMU15 TaxID=882083 RepID=H5XAL7_9PSEU|nr:type VII secretion target [Saccharomonospora marina]EHR51522.1 Protein of unknown function (DUF2580) [Saccharomonospora marina XMU15]